MLDRPFDRQHNGLSDARRMEDEIGDLAATVASLLAADERTPRYELVAHAVEEEIRSGRLRPGMALPPEPELARNLAISRQTLRHALNDLTRSGLLIRR